MNRRDALLQFTAVAASLALPARAQSGRIVLGQSAAFTGPAAQLGIQMNAGARLYFDAAQCRRAASTAPIELRTLDDGYEPDRCAANTEALHQGRRVRPVRLRRHAHQRWRRCRWSTRAKIPFFGPFTGAEALRDPFNRNVVSMCAPSYYDETALIVKQLTTLGLKKIAVFYQNDCLRQGRTGRRDAGAEGAEPHAGGAGHGRAQHGRRGRRR